MMVIDRAALQVEVDGNFAAFREQLPELIRSHPGKFVLLRNGETVEFFDSVRDAMIYAQKAFPDGRYSVQEITDRVVDLGFYSHAVP